MDELADGSPGVLVMMDEFERNIAGGVWPPGMKLPPERNLAVQYGVARNTLRKALDRLERDGRILRKPGSGSFVALKQHSTLISGLSGASPAEVMELRMLLEPRLGELAASRAKAADLQQMEVCLRESEVAIEVAEFEHWDGLLHLAIVRAAHNSLLATIYEAINLVRNQPEWLRLKQRSVTPERRLVYQAQHRDLVAALRDRDADQAYSVLSEHLATVQANMLGLK